MDQVQAIKSDHDILLELSTTVNLQHVETMGKIADVKTEVKNIADGVTTQLGNHEVRIQQLEDSRREFQALRITDISLENNKKITRLQDLSKFIVGLVAVLGATIIWLLTVINNLLQITKR